MNDFHQIHFGWIRESNLIENIDEENADRDSFDAWRKFTEGTLNRDSLMLLHWDVMRRSNSRVSGVFRRVDVRVGYHRAPDYKDIPNLMVKWFRDFGRVGTPEGIRIAHLVFERIHPFEDGNGRIGRMIMNYQRLRAGLDIQVIYAKERAEYYKWFYEKISREYGWASRLVNSAIDDAKARRLRETMDLINTWKGENA